MTEESTPNQRRRKKNPWPKRILLSGFVLLAGAGIAVAMKPKPLEVEVESASRGQLIVTVNEDGVVAGSVSGGCVEGAVVEVALRVLETGERGVHTFGYSDDEAFAVGLTCGGTIHLYVEPLDW